MFVYLESFTVRFVGCFLVSSSEFYRQAFRVSVDEKNDSKEESKSTRPESGSGGSPSPPPADFGLDFNAFDFSGMAGILNVSLLCHFLCLGNIWLRNCVMGLVVSFKDPSIKELAEQIAKDPAFNQLAEQLQRSVPTASHEGGLPNFDPQQYMNTMNQVMHNPEFRTMAERLGNALVQVVMQQALLVLVIIIHNRGMILTLFFLLLLFQDPQMSPFLEALGNPGATEQFAERMAQMKDDPELKPILAEIDAGGPSAMMKYERTKIVSSVRKYGVYFFVLLRNVFFWR